MPKELSAREAILYAALSEIAAIGEPPTGATPSYLETYWAGMVRTAEIAKHRFERFDPLAHCAG